MNNIMGLQLKAEYRHEYSLLFKIDDSQERDVK